MSSQSTGPAPMFRPGLSPERIAHAALEILDNAQDESALTARSLAKKLGVSAPSLYSHVSGMEEIIDLVHRHINSLIGIEVLVGSTHEADFREACHRYRQAYRAHPVAATIIASRAINRDHALKIYEPFAAYLLDRGVPAELVMPVMAMLDNLILGSAVEPFAEAFIGQSADYRPVHPALAVALETTNRSAIDDIGFEIGLDAICRIVTELAATPRTSPASSAS
jgi:AcrR family transcriptional regulator